MQGFQPVSEGGSPEVMDVEQIQASKWTWI